jgi:threonine/homoserine/homoserine lactone efflux protein
MDLTTWLTLTGILCLGAMSPGPSLGLVVQNTAKGGVADGLVTSIAHGVGVGCYALLAALGLVVVIAQWPALFQIMQLGGAAFLLYLGCRSLKASDTPVAEKASDDLSLWGSASSGFFMAFLNPKIALIFLAIFSQLVTPETTMIAKLLMALTAFGVDATWYCLLVAMVTYSGALEKFRHEGGFIQKAFGVVFYCPCISAICFTCLV